MNKKVITKKDEITIGKIQGLIRIEKFNKLFKKYYEAFMEENTQSFNKFCEWYLLDEIEADYPDASSDDLNNLFNKFEKELIIAIFPI